MLLYINLFAVLTTVRVEPVGRWFEAFCTRRRHKQTLSHNSLHSSSDDEEEEDLNDEFEDDEEYLKTLDPKDWKVMAFTPYHTHIL